MIKNRQKSRNAENEKIDKITKTQKVIKSTKSKSDKSDKSEKWKMMKNVSKIDPPSKTPKCQINGQKWHFVKSEPPGPALFEFQGVPRDPILRPKSTPPILNGKKWSRFHFSPFWFYSFWWFLIFCKCVKLINCWEVTFLTPHYVIRPYGNYTHHQFCSRCRGVTQERRC